MKHQVRARADTSRVPQPRRAWLPICIGIAVTALLVGIVALGAGDALRPATSVHVLPVVFDRQMEQVSTESSDNAQLPGAPLKSVQAPGWLEADPFYIACAALADGVVEEILVLEGDQVEAGQTVAKLVDDDARLALAAAEAALSTARARLASAQAQFNAAESDWEHPVERERAVAAAHAALDGARAELAQLPSLIETERATLGRMLEELARSEQALASGAATDIEVIIKQKDTDAQRSRLETTELRGGILRARVVQLEAEHRAAVRNAELRIEERRALDVARAEVLQRDAELQGAFAARDEAALRLTRMTIRSPITGFVQARLKVPGDKVMMGMDSSHSAHILHIYDPASLQVRVDVPLAEAAHIRVGQVCEVVVDVLPDTVFRGEVSRVTHEADLQKNTLQAKVRIINPSSLLRPEMLTRVKFVGGGVSTKEHDPEAQLPRVMIPIAAIHDRSNAGAVVWVVSQRRGDHGIAEPVEVTLLSEQDGWAKANAPLHPGDLLITNAYSPTEGQRVRMQDEGGAA